MCERMARLGGCFVIDTAPGRETTIRVWLGLPDNRNRRVSRIRDAV